MKPATTRPRRSSSRPKRTRQQPLPSDFGQRLPVPVLIAYSDVTSARQAMTRISRMLQASQPNCHLQPMLWRFDQLLKATWHNMALHDARRARVLALAVADEPALANVSETWLGALLERAKGHLLHVLVIVGDTDPWTITLEQPVGNLGPESAWRRTIAPPRGVQPRSTPSLKPETTVPA